MKFVDISRILRLMPLTEYIDLDLQSLIELLVAHIKKYDSMLSTRVFSVEEFTHCKQTLAELHAVIKQKAAEAGFPTENIYPSFPNMER